jgi:threonine aldolase
MYFKSDNSVGASEAVLAALAAANAGPAASYGDDTWTEEAVQLIRDAFEAPKAEVFLVTTGTAANALALSAMCPPYGAIFCHQEAHINVDECGSPELFTGGAKLALIAGEGGKITPLALEKAIVEHPSDAPHGMPPKVLSLTNVTESGRAYTVDEIKALAAIARQHDLLVHMDGARFANAVAHTEATPAELTWRAGVDVLTLGAAKNGALMVEAVIFFKRELAEGFTYRRKRGGHLVSKGRYLGAQMAAYMKDDLWLKNAQHANAMAKLLHEGLSRVTGVVLPGPQESNEVFALLPRALHEKLQAAGAMYYEWGRLSLPPQLHSRDDLVYARLVTSFVTAPEEVDAFIAALQ